MKKPSKVEQFEALVKGKTSQLVGHCFGNESIPDHPYAQIFSISRSEFLIWLKKNYQIKDLMYTYTRHGKTDGFYVIRKLSGKYVVYRQEKCVRFDESVVDSVDDVWEKYVDYCLKSSGTGLPLEWWDK